MYDRLMGKRFDLTRGSIAPLIIRMTIPASIGFFFNTLYALIDQYWAGQINRYALEALGRSFPFFMIILSIGVGISTAGRALISNSLGEGNEKKAELYFTQAIVASLLAYIIFLLPLFLVIEPLMRLTGAQGETLARSLGYTHLIVFFGFIFLINHTMDTALSARGMTKPLSLSMIIGSFLNFFLNPLLSQGVKISSWTIIPALEERGIALATIILQALGILYLFYEVLRHKALKEFKISFLRPNWKILKEIFSQAFPSGISMIMMSLGFIVIQYHIHRMGSGVAIAGYAIGFRFEQIALIPTIGLNIAVSVFVGQNNGARLYQRIRSVRHISWGIGFLFFSALGMPMTFLLAPYLLPIFIPQDAYSAEVYQVALKYINIAAITYLAYITLNVSGAVLQGMKKPVLTSLISIFRVLLIPLIVLPLAWSLDSLFIFFSLIQWTAAILIFFITRAAVFRQLKQTSLVQ